MEHNLPQHEGHIRYYIKDGYFTGNHIWFSPYLENILENKLGIWIEEQLEKECVGHCFFMLDNILYHAVSDYPWKGSIWKKIEDKELIKNLKELIKWKKSQ